MTGIRQDDRKEYDRTKDRQRTLGKYMIDCQLKFLKLKQNYSNAQILLKSACTVHVKQWAFLPISDKDSGYEYSIDGLCEM